MPQETSKIEAKEIKVRDLLSNHLFEIPIYQRPFSWNEDNFQALVEDISDAMESGEESYFLGTVLLRRKKDIIYEVVDGQQRLTSLMILFAVARDLLTDSEIKNELQSYLIQRGSKLGGIPDRMRIQVWKDLENLFSKYIYTKGGAIKLLEDFKARRILYPDRNSPVYHLYEAVKVFRDFADALDQEQLKTFLSYVLQNVYFVYIITDNRSSAFRLFNVLNTRGLPLTAADVLKSMNLEYVPKEKRQEYFSKWRNLEEDLGREELEALISYIRTIYAKEKAKRELVDEFDKLFRENKIRKGVEFFDTVMNYGKIYKEKILEPRLSMLNPTEGVRYTFLMEIMNRFMPFSEWIPPLLFFYMKFGDERSLYEFAFNLERKFFIEWCADFTATERLTSAISLIRLIESSNNPEDVHEKMFESPEEIRRGRKRRTIDFSDRELIKDIILSKLDDQQFYSLKGGKMARYVLLRLDMEMQEENFGGYSNWETITVEHILPRKPQGEWLNVFSEEEVKEIVNKLGNLTLLNKRRNSRASNYEYRKKLEKYFEVTHNPFAITAMLREYSNWNREAFEKRHKDLLNLALRIYLPERLAT